MKIPSTLPITADQSRAARFQLGLTQAQVISASGLQGYKLKQFETGRFIPDIPFLEGLREFYQKQNLIIESEAPAPAPASAPAKGGMQQAAARSGSGIWRPTQRMALYIREDLPEAELMRVFERMEANDDRIESIVAERLEEGMLGPYSEQTEAKTRELFGAMAENYLMFRHLQGRSLVSGTRVDPPETQGDLIASFLSQSPLTPAPDDLVPAVEDADAEEEVDE